jgi:hypothetical protein
MSAQAFAIEEPGPRGHRAPLGKDVVCPLATRHGNQWMGTLPASSEALLADNSSEAVLDGPQQWSIKS